MIRCARLEDAAEIVAIYNPYITDTTVTFETEPVSVEEMSRRITKIKDEEKGIFLVCEMNGHVVGYAYAHPWKERAAFLYTWETAVYVATEHQGKGIGPMLMKELIELCRGNKVHVLVACIVADNQGSLRMHARLGFHQVSHFKEVGYKFGRWLGVIDYELILNNPKNCKENPIWMEKM